MKNELYRTDGTKRTIEAFLLVFSESFFIGYRSFKKRPEYFFDHPVFRSCFACFLCLIR